MTLKAPFPWFGGKSVIASLIWERFGRVQNYVEPFFGSGAVLLRRPDWRPGRTAPVNDLDGMLANFWRGIQHDPEAVAAYADWPVNECDLHARHAWLVGQREDITARLMGDPDYYDAKAAGWWVWGICAWIGGGWCSGEGPWQAVDGRLVKTEGQGITKQLPHLGRGQGITKKRPHLGDRAEWIAEWFATLAERFRDVRVCCGDWGRVCGPSPTTKLGLTAVFLDPPYSAERDICYTVDNFEVAQRVATWCRENGDNPQFRIVLCGYHEEHELPGWTVHRWKAGGGYGLQSTGRGRENAGLETIWFSPHCINPNSNVQALLSL